LRRSKFSVEVFGRSFWSKFLVEVFGRSFWSKFLVEVFGRSFWSKFLVEVFGRRYGDRRYGDATRFHFAAVSLIVTDFAEIATWALQRPFRTIEAAKGSFARAVDAGFAMRPIGG
jgi:hypothetical protein